MFCAQKRNYYWEHERRSTGGNTGITIPSEVHPYPTKGDHISDKPRSDSGGNFGRLARYGIMDDYIKDMLDEKVRGVSVLKWLDFFKRETL